MTAMDAPPPAIFCPAPLPSRNILVWGEDAAMEALRAEFELKGWQWATIMLGEQTKALVLAPPSALSDQEVCSLLNDVNAGKFGNLNAGFATFGEPQAAPTGRGH